MHMLDSIMEKIDLCRDNPKEAFILICAIAFTLLMLYETKMTVEDMLDRFL